MIIEKLKSVVVLVNKWDAYPKDAQTMSQYTLHVRSHLNYLAYVPVLFTSAKTGQRVSHVLPLAVRVNEARSRRIPTSALNRLVRQALESHAPPTKGTKRLKILYATQVRTDPPTILFHVNDPRLVHFSYTRFLENRIREEYDFLGTPLRLTFRRRKNRR
jgi:GTP-binding protein